MSTAQSTSTTIPARETKPADLKIEVAVLSVSDADRAKQFYMSLGWREDADFPISEGFRVLQFTPPGSKASIIFGTGVTSAAPGAGGSAPAGGRRHRGGARRADRARRRRLRGLPRPWVQRRRPGPDPGQGARRRVLRLLRHLQRPRRQRVPAPGGHHPAARAGRGAGHRGARAAAARDRPRPRSLRGGQPRSTTGGTGTPPTSARASRATRRSRRPRPPTGT